MFVGVGRVLIFVKDRRRKNSSNIGEGEGGNVQEEQEWWANNERNANVSQNLSILGFLKISASSDT